jgi:hypothetical protein
MKASPVVRTSKTSSPLEEAETLVQTAMEPNPDSTSKNTRVSVAVIFRGIVAIYFLKLLPMHTEAEGPTSSN